jgi:sugar phosphate permease
MRLYRRRAPVSAVYFCYNLILWLMLDWMPLYFMHSFHLNIKKAVVFTSGVFIAGVVGDLVGGLVSDRLLRKTGNVKLARSYFVAFCMALTGLSLVPVVLLHDPVYSLVFLGAAMFFNEMNIGPMWAIPMDIAYDRAGTASGIMSGNGFIAAIVSPVVAGYVVDHIGNWNVTFMLSIGIMICGILLSFAMKPDVAFAESTQADKPRGIAEPSTF